jgi:hypothetical protein
MRHVRPLLLLALVAPCLAIAAQDPKPEIARKPSTPQADGVVHTLRTIPEACARIEGQFTGQAADPYKFALARTSPNCPPRARLVSADKVKPTTQDGWTFNDKIVVPSKSCATQEAVVRIWRKTATNAPPDLDAQGRSRIYLKDATDSLKAKGAPAVPMFAVAMAVEGTPCAK